MYQQLRPWHFPASKCRAGHICGRLEEDWEGVPIVRHLKCFTNPLRELMFEVNMIREAMLVEESELYDTFTAEERKEPLGGTCARIPMACNTDAHDISAAVSHQKGLLLISMVLWS